MRKKVLSAGLCSVLSLSLLASANPWTVNAQSKQSQAVQSYVTGKGTEWRGIPLNGLIPETASDATKIELENGMTKSIYSTDDAIIENLFVETETDSDRDGKRDRVSIKVYRPKTDPGVKVPVIYEMSPYRSGILDVPVFNVDVDLNPVSHPGNGYGRSGKPYALAEGQAANLGSLGNYFVPRGYGVILAESIGTGKSDGCPTTGDEREILGTKAVIDWLNGRAKAFTGEGKEVHADWSTGNVGMTGASYNGTLPNAVAATGVDGLKTIIPVAAISSWYDYYRANGAVIAPGGYQGEDADNLAEAVLTRSNPEVCKDVIAELKRDQDRVTGDYNQFWADRDYVKDADKIKASVLVVHGLNDWNVKTKQFAQWWEALGENNVQRKLWLHQGGHSNPSGADWTNTRHKWFDYYLYGIENGIMDEPAVNIQREDRTYSKEASWPAPGTVSTNLHLTGTGNDLGAMVINPVPNQPHNKQTIIDDPMIKANALIANPELNSPNRLAYVTQELTGEVRISGTPKVSIRASIDRPVANLTALLIDYSSGKSVIVSRGWVDPQNLHYADRSESLVAGRDYTFEWAMEPKDYIFKAGHRIGVVLISSDYDYTIRPKAGTKITVIPTRSEITLPIVGGKNAFNQ
ncbi:Xaa-Pro dipeptidyl-peptidase [Neobacillus kokaensis]|uniref:Xaa-Pro dipeptidyl-peptidase n=1 Tax=Neobacillus kokaensis TaxID=2759023 RepID=A0ABQ3N962_9BACI|nr:Xaa-Pro dipeptidyl-peptidase [Neobacillus kokaensis]GHI00742.1 Xaa-Pro dipeptidyl-peptidase [Neobacillus kokaensis]